MNTLLLHPSDILFFRDGRPMSGSLSGHGAAWPLPSVTNAALHAALHRADLKGMHFHKRGRSSNRLETAERDRKFGSLTTAGPFPVCTKGATATWYFPRPLDAGLADSAAATFLPLAAGLSASSLPIPLRYPVANTLGPDKNKPKPWWSEGAWNAYLGTSPANGIDFKSDSEFSDTEHSIGIGIDSATGTQDGEQFYSAHYLRLREGWRLGLFAEALDKIDQNPGEKRDLLESLFPNHGAETPVIIGGQQRLCSVLRETPARLPLPLGKHTGFENSGKFLVKWTLLTPAIYPEINAHPGGWLPSWIRQTDGQVMLRSGETARREGEGREKWRKRVSGLENLSATLVAAMTGKPVPVTGYALDNGLEDRSPGPKPTHLAVPAGSVYYFECADETAANALAAALNWHGSDTAFSTIQNRRSTLMGEKGFGLGICSAWSFHPGDIPGHP